MAKSEGLDLRYDFSVLSKRRLATYNLLVEELERQEASNGHGLEGDVLELGDDVLELLSAAGTAEIVDGVPDIIE